MTRFFRFSLCAGLFAACLWAQQDRATLVGTVTDPTGAVVPQVKVTIVQTTTNLAIETRTNESGQFRAPNLPIGEYRVEFEAPGFRKVVRDGIRLSIQDVIRVDVRLEVGATTESLTVTAEVPLLNTETPEVGQVLGTRQVIDLPLGFSGGRYAENFAFRLTPGVSGNNWTSHINGAPSFSKEVVLDGASATIYISGHMGESSPSMEALEEFKIQTSGMSAEFTRTAGGVFNFVMKSGTNQFHGSGMFQLHNESFDANTFANNFYGRPRQFDRRHNWATSLGGPVWIPKVVNGKDKWFFYAAYEKYKEQFAGGGSPTVTVPTEAWWNGDFSNYLTGEIIGKDPLGRDVPRGGIYDPATYRLVGGQVVRDLFPGNRIPSSLLDRVGQNLVNLYPAPNQEGRADGTNNHFYVDVRRQEYNTHLGRMDHAFSDSHRLFFRINDYGWGNTQDRFGNPAGRFHTRQARQGLALDDVLILSRSMVLNLRYGLTFAKFGEQRGTQGIDLASLGFSPALVSLVDAARAPAPRVQVGAYTPLSNWNNGDGANTSLIHTLMANLTQVRGPHSLRYGADIRVYRGFGTRTPQMNAPDFNFATTYTSGPLDNAPAAPLGQELAAMLLGVPDGVMELTASYAVQDKFVGLFFQDDWRVNSRLTLNIGLRYEYESPVTERFDRLVAGYDFVTANPIEAQARTNYALSPIPEIPPAAFRATGGLQFVTRGGFGRSPFWGERNNFMPRVGLAYRFAGDTVLRAGYGMYFDSIGVNRTIAQQTGFSQATLIQASLDNGVTYVATNANPLPNGLISPRGADGGLATSLGQGFTFYDPALKYGYSQRWSLGLQRLLPGQFLAEISYVANRGTRLGVNRQFNATPAQYLSTSPLRDQTVINSLTQTFSSPFFGLAPSYPRTISRADLLRPYPHFGNLSAVVSDGYSWYHSLQLRGERRLRNGVSLQASYVWSKFMEATEFLNAADARPYESISQWDRPHRITASGIWEIPVGRGRRFGRQMPGAANFLLGNWQLNGIWAVQSGQPLGFGNAIFLGDIKSVALPAGVRSVERWFNTDGFNRDARQQLQFNYRQFPLRFSGIRGDGQRAWDFSLFKTFPVAERIQLQFRAEVYNALNQASFNNPNTTPTSAAFGAITDTASDARNWQLSLWLKF